MGKPTPRPAAGLLMWQASPLDHVGSRIFVVACHQGPGWGRWKTEKEKRQQCTLAFHLFAAFLWCSVGLTCQESRGDGFAVFVTTGGNGGDFCCRVISIECCR